MTDTTDDLERALLRQPLDLALRERYVADLIARGDTEAALTQIELLVGLPGATAAHVIRAAQTALHWGAPMRRRRNTAKRNVAGIRR